MNKKDNPMKLGHYHLRPDQHEVLEEISKETHIAKSKLLRQAFDLLVKTKYKKYAEKLQRETD